MERGEIMTLGSQQLLKPKIYKKKTPTFAQ